MPQGVLASVRGIEQQGYRVESAASGSILDIGLKLPNDFDVNYLKKGTVLCDPQFSIPLVKRFVARIVIYETPQGCITKGEEVMVHSYTSKSPGKISSLLSTVD
jgi:translation elongation factor EF-1alpha